MKPEPIDARDLADGRPCKRRNCRRPVLTIIVRMPSHTAYEECERGHRQ